MGSEVSTDTGKQTVVTPAPITPEAPVTRVVISGDNRVLLYQHFDNASIDSFTQQTESLLKDTSSPDLADFFDSVMDEVDWHYVERKEACDMARDRAITNALVQGGLVP